MRSAFLDFEADRRSSTTSVRCACLPHICAGHRPLCRMHYLRRAVSPTALTKERPFN